MGVGYFLQMTLVPAALGVRVPDHGSVLSASERRVQKPVQVSRALFTLDLALFPFWPFKTTFITADSFLMFILFDVQAWQFFDFSYFTESKKFRKAKWLGQGHTAILGRAGTPCPHHSSMTSIVLALQGICALCHGSHLCSTPVLTPRSIS